MYPVAQVQEPYTAVGYLAQRIPLIQILKVKHPEEDPSPEGAANVKWSAWDICDGKFDVNSEQFYVSGCVLG